MGPALRGTTTTPKMTISKGAPPKKCCAVVPVPFWPALFFPMFPQWRPGEAKRMPKSNPRGTRNAEMDQFFTTWPPPGASSDFFRPRGRPEALQEASGEAPEADSAPKGRPEASRGHFGAILAPFSTPWGSIFHVFRQVPLLFCVCVLHKFLNMSSVICLATKGGRRCWRSHSQ